MIGALMAALHLLGLLWGAAHVVAWLAIPFSIIAERGKKDPRFEGERLWYRT